MHKLILLIFSALIIIGCASKQPKRPIFDPYYRPEIKLEPITKPLPAKPKVKVKPIPIKRPPAPKPKPVSPAIIALLTKADASAKLGKFDEAAATIERALRIEPRNANLIYKLAEIRLKQGKPRLAENLGQKTNLLSSGNAVMKRKSWLLIAEARRKQGNFQGAAEAETKAGRY